MLRSSICWFTTLALVLTLSEAVLSADLDEFKVKRQEVFEFTRKPTLARPQSIAGTVCDTDGRPVTGAYVVLPSDDLPKLGCMVRTLTDEQGNYRFYLTPRTVEIRCGGTWDRYAESRNFTVPLAAAQPVTGVDLQVKSSPPFHGQVLLPNGKPARQAEIDVVLTDVSGKVPPGGDGMLGDGTRHFRVSVDEQGQFTGCLLGPWARACEGKVTLKFTARSADRSMLATAEADTMADAAPLQVKIVLTAM